MDYNQFIDSYIALMQKELSEQQAQVVRANMRLVNGLAEAITIRYKGSEVCPVVYLEQQYNLYKSGFSVEELVTKTIRELEIARAKAPQKPQITEESLKENLYCSVINVELNRELLQTVPHRIMEDLAVIARYKIDGVGCFTVTNDLANSLKLTSEEVMAVAYANHAKQDFVLQSMSDMMRDLLLSQGAPEEFVEDVVRESHTESPIYVLTNQARHDGASAILSKEIMAKAQEMLGDFYILPSSRHEVILIKKDDGISLPYLKNMVKEINAVEVKREDLLSDNVYLYDSRTRRIVLADRELQKERAPEQVKVHSRAH